MGSGIASAFAIASAAPYASKDGVYWHPPIKCEGHFYLPLNPARHNRAPRPSELSLVTDEILTIEEIKCTPARQLHRIRLEKYLLPPFQTLIWRYL